MAVNKPDEYQHNNPNLAFVDADFIRGGGRVVDDLTALYALSTKADQLKVRVTRVWVTAEAKYYVLKDMANVANTNGWEVESTGGEFEPKIPKSTGLLSWAGSTWEWIANNFIPGSRKITINGTQQDLTADRTWIIDTGDKHTHANKAALDLINKDGNNAPTWNGGAWPGSGGAALDYSTNIEADKLSTTKVSAIKTLYDWAAGKFAAIAHTHAYSSLTGLPTLFSGAWADLTGKPTLFSGSYNDLTDKPTIPEAYTHPLKHPTTILDGVDAVNGAEDYYLNQKGEFKKVEAGSSETGLTIRAKLEGLTGGDKLNYSALQGVVSSYTLDFRDDVTQIQDINIEGAIRIDAIQVVNVATLQLGAVTLTLPLSAPINIAQGAYNVWTITRNTASAASVGIKYTKL